MVENCVLVSSGEIPLPELEVTIEFEGRQGAESIVLEELVALPVGPGTIEGLNVTNPLVTSDTMEGSEVDSRLQNVDQVADNTDSSKQITTNSDVSSEVSENLLNVRQEEEDGSVYWSYSSSPVDIRPDSLKNLVHVTKFLRGLNKLTPIDLEVYNHPISDQNRLSINSELREKLKMLFHICLSNQPKIYDRNINSCLRKLFQLQFLDIPEIWKDTIHDLTSDFIERVTEHCITTDDLTITQFADETIIRLKILLCGSMRPVDRRLSLFNLQMLEKIISVTIPEKRGMDEEHFNKLHQSIAFYKCARVVVHMWSQVREFVEHERIKMVELLKKVVAEIQDRTYYIHDKCPLVQIEITEIYLLLESVVEVIEKF